MPNNYMQTGGNTGLGDYIHLKGENYKNYGFFRSSKGKTKSQSFATAAHHTYATLKNMIKEKTVKGNVHQIETLLTAIYRQNWNDPAFQIQGIDLSNISNQENQLAQAVEQKVDSIGVVFDRTNMGLNSIANFKSYGDKLYSYQGTNKGSTTKTITKSSLIKVVNTISIHILQLQEIIKNGNINLQKVNYILSELRRTRNFLYAALQKSTDNFQKGVAIRRPSGDLNVVGEAIQYAKVLGRSYGKATSTEIGDTGELGALAGLFVIDNKINFTVDDLLSGIVGGTEAGSKNIDQTSKLYARFNLEDEKEVEFRTTQDTVDIQLKVNNTDLFGSKIFGASVKNYSSFSHGITIISGVNLETILGLTGSAFGNHMLNRMVQHEDKVEFDDLGFGNNIVAYALAVRGLSGARYLGFNKLSSYLIAYNRSAKFVKVYSTRDILDRICPTPFNFMYNLVDIEGFPVSKSNYPNKSEPSGANVRIAKIMAQVRKEKLKMSLKPAFFNI